MTDQTPDAEGESLTNTGSPGQPRRRAGLFRLLLGPLWSEIDGLRRDVARLRVERDTLERRLKDLESRNEEAFATMANLSAPAPSVLDDRGMLRCRGIEVVDGHGRLRFEVASDAAGENTATWLDPHGRRRIIAGTSPTGDAAVLWRDVDGHRRMNAVTAVNGSAGISWTDRRETLRVGVVTKPSGTSGVHVFDRNGKIRISAATFENETLALPTVDLGAVPD
jgi:hypothetical protein